MLKQLPVFLIFVSCLFALPAYGGSLETFGNALDNMADMAREADRAEDAFTRHHSQYMDHYGRATSREMDMAYRCGTDPDTIHHLRERGLSWEEIGQRYNVDSRPYFGRHTRHHGHHGYHR